MYLYMKLPKQLNNNQKRILAKNSMVMFQGEVPQSAFVVKSGIVRSYSIDDKGNGRIINFFGPGDIFPLDWLYSDSRSVLFYYETLTEAELIPLSKQHFTDSLNDSESQDYINFLLRKELTSSAIRSLSLQQPLASEKIVYLFYYFSIRFGKEVIGGIFNLGIPLTHQLIADSLGLTRETVAAELSKLKKTGAVAYKKKQYLVNKKLLIRAVGKEITDSLS